MTDAPREWTQDEIDDDFDQSDDGVGCYDCHGGWKIICPDDCCHGSYDGGPYAPCGDDRCVIPCRNCNKDGCGGF